MYIYHLPTYISKEESSRDTEQKETKGERLMSGNSSRQIYQQTAM